MDKVEGPLMNVEDLDDEEDEEDEEEWCEEKF